LEAIGNKPIHSWAGEVGGLSTQVQDLVPERVGHLLHDTGMCSRHCSDIAGLPDAVHAAEMPPGMYYTKVGRRRRLLPGFGCFHKFDRLYIGYGERRDVYHTSRLQTSLLSIDMHQREQVQCQPKSLVVGRIPSIIPKDDGSKRPQYNVDAKEPAVDARTCRCGDAVWAKCQRKHTVGVSVLHR